MIENKQDEELLKRAEALQQEAKRIVDELGIFPILNKISKPFFIGSVENGLMVWPDIDIQADMEELSIYKVLDLLRELALLPTIQKVQFSNFRELRRDFIESKKRLPHGYYIGLRSVQPSGEWKIDIWFGGPKTDINEYPANSLSIDREQKIAILNIKNAWMGKAEKGGYKDGVISVDIYKAVLENGVMNEDDFREYLINKK